MLKQLAIPALTIAISASALLPGFAQGPGMGGPGGVSAPGQRPDPVAIYQEAGANEQQIQQIRDLAKEFEKGAVVKVERLRNLLGTMQGLSLEADPDQNKVLATQDEISNLQADMAMTRIKLMLKIRQVLKPEQRVRLVQLMKQRNTAYQPQRGGGQAQAGGPPGLGQPPRGAAQGPGSRMGGGSVDDSF